MGIYSDSKLIFQNYKGKKRGVIRLIMGINPQVLASRLSAIASSQFNLSSVFLCLCPPDDCPAPFVSPSTGTFSKYRFSKVSSQVPQMVVNDIEKHIPCELLSELIEKIRILFLSQSRDDFQLRSSLCLQELINQGNCEELSSRISLCAEKILSYDQFLQIYKKNFTFKENLEMSLSRGEVPNLLKLATDMCKNEKLCEEFKSYGISVKVPRTRDEASFFFSQLEKRISTLFDHQFPAIQDYFECPKKIAYNTKKLFEFFELENYRNIVILHDLTRLKKAPKAFDTYKRFLSSSPQNPQTILRETATKCLNYWRRRPCTPRFMHPPFLNLMNESPLLPFRSLTKIPNEFVDFIKNSSEPWTDLSFADHDLCALPLRLRELPLHSLNITGNCFEQFPEDVFQIRTLKSICVEDNFFAKISPESEKKSKQLGLHVVM